MMDAVVEGGRHLAPAPPSTVTSPSPSAPTPRWFVFDRPEHVRAVCKSKFKALQDELARQLKGNSTNSTGRTVSAQSTPARGWVFTGETQEVMYLNSDGENVTSDDVFGALVARWVAHHDRHRGHEQNTQQAGDDCATAEDPSSASHPRLLDLGCGTGSLLGHLNQSLGWPFSRMLGISAVDERPAAAEEAAQPAAQRVAPDASYLVANIDNLHEIPELRDQRFDVVWSSHTFYHLVDPIGALCSVYNLLSPGGVAILRHVPAIGTGITPHALRAFCRAYHFQACVASMPDSPGNDMVLLKRPSTMDLAVHVGPVPPPTMAPPFSYTGAIATSGSYKYAVLSAHNAGTQSKAQQGVAKNKEEDEKEEEAGGAVSAPRYRARNDGQRQPHRVQQQQEQQEQQEQEQQQAQVRWRHGDEVEHAETGSLRSSDAAEADLKQQEEQLLRDPALFLQAVVGVHPRSLVGVKTTAQRDRDSDSTSGVLGGWASVFGSNTCTVL